MPGVDWIPGVSQLKSIVQLATGDVDGALNTQANFLQECPVVAQGTSVVQLCTGDSSGALETQRRCLGTVNNVANGVPVVGHLKGVIHHAVGDHDGGNQALNAATRSTVVIGSGVAVGLASGGLAAIPAGIAAGMTYDTTATLVTGESQGIVAAIDNAVKNPTGGNIFDAIAIPVGDGLAGHAGGKMGGQIAQSAKINALEVARDSKNTQLEQALFDNGPGNAYELGVQVKQMTADLGNLKASNVPQYYHDLKTNTIVVENSAQSSAAAVPIVGYFDETPDKGFPGTSTNSGHSAGKEEQEKPEHREIEISPPNKIDDFVLQQENGLESDLYVVNRSAGRLTLDQKKAILVKYKNQIPTSRSLQDQYPSVPFYSIDEFARKSQQPPQKPTGKQQKVFHGWVWLDLNMPQEFNYTGAILANSLNQGLQHTFVRHFDQWVEQIPELAALMNDLDPIRTELDAVLNAEDQIASQNALQELFEAIRLLDVDTFNQVQNALHHIQMQIHDYVQKHLQYTEYLGEGVNDIGCVQVYFKVTDALGNVRVMVVCVSKQLYPWRLDGDRNIRTITTIFFISWEDFKKKIVRKTF